MRPTRSAFERPWLTLSGAVILSACASAQSPPGYDTPKDGGTIQGIGDDDAGGAIVTGDSGKSGHLGDDSSDQGDGCSDASRLVYVISDVNDLYSFTPTTLKFAKIGTLNCPAGSATVNSMAVDRSGTAWVNYTDGKLYKVSTADASCATTTFKPNQESFTNELGMGFSSDTPGSKAETLFVSDNSGLGLGKVDLGTMKLTALGAYTGSEAGANAELTGTGDARLFGFFATSPAAYAQVDKTTGATASVIPLTSPGATVNASDGGYAFSFWGGDFWFYTAYPTTASPNATTSVTRYSPAGTVAPSVVLSEIGFVIVGAGVSTCAPVAPPK